MTAKLTVAALSLLALGTFPAAAETADEIRTLIAKISTTPATDEGGREKCITREPIFKTCIARNRYLYRTNPGELSTTIGKAVGSGEDINARGTISYRFDCRVRKQRYEAGILTRTDDSNSPGTILADFRITFGELSILNVRSENADHRCGNAIQQRMRSY